MNINLFFSTRPALANSYHWWATYHQYLQRLGPNIHESMRIKFHCPFFAIAKLFGVKSTFVCMIENLRSIHTPQKIRPSPDILENQPPIKQLLTDGPQKLVPSHIGIVLPTLILKQKMIITHATSELRQRPIASKTRLCHAFMVWEMAMLQGFARCC